MVSPLRQAGACAALEDPTSLSRGPAQQTLLPACSAELKEMGMNASVQLFSSLKRDGADEAEGVLRDWLGVPKKEPGSKGMRSRANIALMLH
jgi:hypothetical protein